jgi:hypothetical protein
MVREERIAAAVDSWLDTLTGADVREVLDHAGGLVGLLEAADRVERRRS